MILYLIIILHISEIKVWCKIMTYEEMVNFLRNRRIELGMSQTQFGQKINMMSQNINRFETARRKVGLDTLMMIADALDCEIIIIPKDTNETEE